MDQRSTAAEPAVDAPTEDAGYSGRRTADIVGITYRQLDYWARTGVIRPSLVDASGSGSRRRYSYRDLLELRVVKTLLDAGIRLEVVRRVFQYVREQLGEDVASAHIVIDGSSVMVLDGDQLVDVVRGGQGVLNILALATVKDQVDARIVELGDRGPAAKPRGTAATGS